MPQTAVEWRFPKLQDVVTHKKYNEFGTNFVKPLLHGKFHLFPKRCHIYIVFLVLGIDEFPK